VTLARNVGYRMRSFRLAKGWTLEELAERSCIAVSTLKLSETQGKGSFHRHIHISIALGFDGEIRNLFADTTTAESIGALKRAER
jgi:transcriptional regulator with XRE-family HTH domain